jgi:signal transduction histidine kinase
MPPLAQRRALPEQQPVSEPMSEPMSEKDRESPAPPTAEAPTSSTTTVETADQPATAPAAATPALAAATPAPAAALPDVLPGAPEGNVTALNQRIYELTKDIGAVLHANTSTLFMAHHALDVALHALAPSPFADDGAPSTEEVDEALGGPAQVAARSIDKVLQVLADPERAGTVPDVDALREELGDFAATLRDFVTHIPIEESRASTLRTITQRIQVVVDGMPPQTLPKEVLRSLRQAAHEVERITALAALLQTRSAIMQMDYTIRSFREFVTTDMRQRETPRKLRVAKLIESACRQLAEYAHASHVAMRRKHDAAGAEVVGVKRELVRALTNLLHNAIKYSWRRERSSPAWVEIRVYRQDHRVCIAFENWGVPISAREIEEGMIFELGYRGTLSTDRGRLGTGVGLTDTRDIVHKHRGEIVVESRPARPWGPDDPDREEYYRQPFLTTFTICLPEAI